MIQSLFVNGNYARPPSLQVQTATEEAFYDFFLGDPRRQCFIVLGTHELLVETLNRLMHDPQFDKENFRFYGVSFVMADRFRLNGNAEPFKHLVYTHWLPPFNSPMLLIAFSAWHEGYTAALRDDPPATVLADADHHAVKALDRAREAYADTVLATTYKGYMMMKTTLEVVRNAIAAAGMQHLNRSTTTATANHTTEPLSWRHIVAAQLLPPGVHHRRAPLQPPRPQLPDAARAPAVLL